MQKYKQTFCYVNYYCAHITNTNIPNPPSALYFEVIDILCAGVLLTVISCLLPLQWTDVSVNNVSFMSFLED